MDEILDDQFLDKKPKYPKRSKWFYLFLVLLLLGSVISSIIAWHDVESIIGSGPIMSAIGLIVFLFAIKIKSTKLAFLGLLPLAISIFWLFAINAFSLSPSDCRLNTPVSISLATLLLLFIGIPMFKNR